MCSSDLFPSHDNHEHLAANKTVAWIDYMTNYNRTFGDFAAGGALDFMVLNRRYEVGNDNTIKDLTTYIDPQKYIEIFADTSIDSHDIFVYKQWYKQRDEEIIVLNKFHSYNYENN